MNIYTVYNSNGEICYLFSGTLENLNLNLDHGLSFIEGEYSAIDYKIVDGQPVAKTGDEKLTPIDEVWVELRNARNIELSLCDWTQVPDAPVDHAAWATYRQALRDLPDNTTDPRNPTWPTKPN